MTKETIIYLSWAAYAVGIVLTYIYFRLPDWKEQRKYRNFKTTVKPQDNTWGMFILDSILSILFPLFWVGHILYEAIKEWDWSTPPRWL